MKSTRIEIIFIFIALVAGIAANVDPAFSYGENRHSQTFGFLYPYPTGSPTSYPTTTPTLTLALKSAGANDGWILESTETSNTGGTMNNIATTFNLGDNATDKQYRAILSFNTSSLPDNAVITKVTLKVKQHSVVGGGNPVSLFQGFKVDIKTGLFGAGPLELGDFKATASKTYGPFSPTLSNGWYSLNLTTRQAYINKVGHTQLRLRFNLDDNNNNLANFLKLYSGNAGVADRPQLIIQYYVP